MQRREFSFGIMGALVQHLSSRFVSGFPFFLSTIGATRKLNPVLESVASLATLSDEARHVSVIKLPLLLRVLNAFSVRPCFLNSFSFEW